MENQVLLAAGSQESSSECEDPNAIRLKHFHDRTRSVLRTPGLKSEVNLVGGISLLVGTIIGSGIFASPKTVMVMTNSVGSSLLVWAACGVIAMFASLVYVELGTMFPSNGAEFTYILKAFGDLPAFLFIFVNVFLIKPASFCLVALTCGDYLMEAFQRDHSSTAYVKLIASALIGTKYFIFYYCRVLYLTQFRSELDRISSLL